MVAFSVKLLFGQFTLRCQLIFFIYGATE